ncbi:hypothetical protein D3C75_953690 [compost metagenome]
MLVILGRDQVNIVAARQQRVHRLLHLRIEVHRVDELHVGVAQGQFGQGQANAFETGAEVLPAVAGDQHHALAGMLLVADQ